jgi:hypothetical protein
MVMPSGKPDWIYSSRTRDVADASVIMLFDE